jgi:hypothetical protein
MIQPADLVAASRARGVRVTAPKLVEVDVFHSPRSVHSRPVGN